VQAAAANWVGLVQASAADWAALVVQASAANWACTVHAAAKDDLARAFLQLKVSLCKQQQLTWLMHALHLTKLLQEAEAE
jgi:hypothetical protein